MKHLIVSSLILAVGVSSFAAGAQYGATWSTADVIPVVLVKPDIGGFTPTEGSSIGNSWTKTSVKAVVLVKPGIGGFVPTDGSSIGNTWAKGDVLPISIVVPGVSGFTSFQGNGGPTPSVPVVSSSAAAHANSATYIETQINGDFEGWEGETIVKLTNGQIWQQTEYYYTYHYAFMPKVFIFKSGTGFKMKVEGVDRAVGVTQLR